MIHGLDRVGGLGQLPASPGHADGLPGFGDTLDALLRPAAKPAPAPAAEGPGGLVFTKHAQARLASRGIELDAEDTQDLGRAIDQLQKKGSRESLVLLGENAFIVGVADRKVITALSRQEAIGNIFTTLDSTVVVR
jgi:flagellar operon protein